MVNIPEGHLSPEERQYLTDFVVNTKPKIILESGTWKGGGSTLSLAKGLFHNKTGTLHTYETYTPYYDIANTYYQQSEYDPYVKLHNTDFVDGISLLSDEELSNVDAVFLDGGDYDPDGQVLKFSIEEYRRNPLLSENVQAFIKLNSFLKINSHILFHDWSHEHGRGLFVNMYLDMNEDVKKNYKLINLIPSQTGLAHFVKIG